MPNWVVYVKPYGRIVPKNFGDAGSIHAPIEMGSLLTPRNTLLPNMCYAKLVRSKLTHRALLFKATQGHRNRRIDRLHMTCY